MIWSLSAEVLELTGCEICGACSVSENSALIAYRQTLTARGDQPAIPEKLKPLGVSKTDNCEKLTTPLENYKMYHQEGEAWQRSMVASLDNIY